MGMFDYVNFKMACPQCGEEMTGWQSKSGNCTMETVDPQHVAYFYGGCDECRVSVDFERTAPAPTPRATPYTADEVKAMGFTMMVERHPPHQDSGETK